MWLDNKTNAVYYCNCMPKIVNFLANAVYYNSQEDHERMGHDFIFDLILNYDLDLDLDFNLHTR